MAVAGFAAAACSTGSSSKSGSPPVPTSTSISGTIQGRSVGGETLGLYGVPSASSPSPYVGALIVGSPGASNWCSTLERGGTALPSTTALSIQVSNINDSNPVSPGTYTMGTSSDGKYVAVAQFIAIDSSCNLVVDDEASGAVTLDAVSPAMVAGTLDLMFMGDHVTGQFAGPVCPLDQGTMSGGCAGDAGDQ